MMHLRAHLVKLRRIARTLRVIIYLMTNSSNGHNYKNAIIHLLTSFEAP
jgi:hypothetical protein